MIDFEAFEKYSKPGPRYTSYPSAVSFKVLSTTKTYEEELRNQHINTPLSLYIHLPFCKSACYFCGCNVVFTSKDEKKDRYIKYLKKEIDILANYIDVSRSVSQLHLGGGTPTFLSYFQLEKVLNIVRKKFQNFKSNAELSCEVDPRFFTKNHMMVLSDYGFNRISFGVQDFNLDVQGVINRKQSYKITKQAVDLARSFNVLSVNIDLMYGLPMQSFKTFKKTLDSIKLINPDRIALFNYAHVPWIKKTMRKIDETLIPQPAEKLKILKGSVDFFCSNGYKMIGMDHFAKPQDELYKAIKKRELYRNFQGYTTKKGTNLIGIGLTSISESNHTYTQNFKDMKLYEKSIDNMQLPLYKGVKLNKDDLIRKYVIIGFMSNLIIDIPLVEKEFGIVFNEYFTKELKDLSEYQKSNIVYIDDNMIKAVNAGVLLIRNLCMPFDAYLKEESFSKKNVFSKTV